MEKRTQNIYVNPNFKKAQIDSWPKDQSTTTYFNRHYLDEETNRIKTASNLNNRKIYVNPNFIPLNNRPQNIACNQENGIKNTEKKIETSHDLHRSKYSIIKNVYNKYYSNIAASCNSVVSDARIENVVISKTNHDKCVDLYENMINVSNSKQKLPLKRSKYCIVRNKNQVSSNTTEYRSNSNSNEVLKLQEIPGQSSQQTTCYPTIHSVQDLGKNNLSSKASEKVTKIKISKYKTVPITYIKNKSERVCNTKLRIKSYSQIKKTSKIFVLKKNSYKFIKPNLTAISDVPMKSVSNLKNQKMIKICDKSDLRVGTKFKVNNIPCRLFVKYGKCLRQEQGTCKYLHDRKHVSVCRKFLKGICCDSNCTLSHELTDKKMPTCFFYLKGTCTKDNCPYVHVKLSDKIKICENFFNGYCENGDKCSYRHIETKTNKLRVLIKKSSTNNTSSKFTPNKMVQKRKIKAPNNLKFNNTSLEKDQNAVATTGENSSDCRYYKDLESNVEVTCEIIKPSRCKLGTLPSFIEL